MHSILHQRASVSKLCMKASWLKEEFVCLHLTNIPMFRQLSLLLFATGKLDRTSDSSLQRRLLYSQSWMTEQVIVSIVILVLPCIFKLSGGKILTKHCIWAVRMLYGMVIKERQCCRVKPISDEFQKCLLKSSSFES